MKIVTTFLFLFTTLSLCAQRYWVGTSLYTCNFNSAADLADWSLVEDNGTGSVSLTGRGSVVLRMDNAAGSFANRIFNVNGASPRRLTLDKVNGRVEFHVIALTGVNQRFFLQVQEFNASGTYITEQNILPAQTTTGYFSVPLNTITWNAATTQIRFMIGGANFSSQQGTIEFDYFNYTNTSKNWSSATNWSITPGGSGGATPPTSAEVAVFDGSTSNSICFLDTSPSVAGITINGYTGSIDLRGSSITTTGTNTFATGSIVNTGAAASVLINTTGTTTFSGTTFHVPVSGSSARVVFNGSTFNQPLAITKTANNVDVSNGGNTFNSTASFTTNAGTLRLAGTTGDAFNNNVTFVQAGGTLQPAYNGSSTFTGNISTNSSAAIVFGANTGSVTFTGTQAQVISKTAGTASPVIGRLIMNKPSNTLTLNTDITVSVLGTFTSGVIVSTATNYINFADGADVTGASNASHVDGPVLKTGTNAFSFPTGDNGIYRTIAITTPVLSSVFSAEYFKTPQTFGTAKDFTLYAVSACEYWTLDRLSGIGFPFVTLTWKTSDCSPSYVTDISKLRVSHWSGSAWQDFGLGVTTGNASAGSITTLLFVASFSPFTIGTVSSDNPLPVTLIDFQAVPDGRVVHLAWTTASEINNDYFDVERSVDNIKTTTLGRIEGHGNSVEELHYAFTDQNPVDGTAYYRLKQVDYDGTTTFSEPVAVTLDLKEQTTIRLHPNPAHRERVYLPETSDITILNSTGRVVMEGRAITSFDVSDFPPGLYIVRDRNGRSVQLVIE